MADLNPLIRVRKYAVEQKQKFLAELYRQANELQSRKQAMLDQLAEEEIKIQDMGVEMLPYFGPYSQAVRERVDEINDSIAVLDRRIEIAREDMRFTFAEFKKIELTQEARDDAEIAALHKREADELDEIALQIFRRQQADG
jgi:flagellar export protein FliJ